ncbi:MAG TPA: gamma-glutamyl-gamma-aminobutyrate hydrolase family protein [Candidatus Bathyarchaeia archaeon]|nr:gamma-glutamyl-gamma-aminobutyrate hydrolase family protein [Candidatus Bathyarchaeia archaeon]
MRPVIGIACSKMFFAGNNLDQFFYVSQAYAEGIARSGGIPYLLPLLSSEGAPYAEMVEKLDGIILTGGEDPAPHLYGEQPLPGLGEVVYERDLAEITLIQLAVERKKPILGICRGMQILNVALGGTLYQDIPSQITGAYQHAQRGSRQYGAHTIRLEPGFVAEALQKTEVLVNSSHHQSVKDAAPGFRVTARSGDGVIEAIESENRLFIGVQWHPERMWMHDDSMLKLAAAFVQTSQTCKL